MDRIDIQITTSNPDALGRVLHLVSTLATVDRDHCGYRHTTVITVFDENGRSRAEHHSTCADPEVLNGEINGIVRVVHHRGPMNDQIPVLVYGLAARLLHAAEITDPDSDEPLSETRAQQLAEDLDGEDHDIRGDLPARQWVAAHVLLACERIVENWTASLQGTAEDIAHRDRAPSPAWHRANAELSMARQSWPGAVHRVRVWLSGLR